MSRQLERLTRIVDEVAQPRVQQKTSVQEAGPGIRRPGSEVISQEALAQAWGIQPRGPQLVDVTVQPGGIRNVTQPLKRALESGGRIPQLILEALAFGRPLEPQVLQQIAPQIEVDDLNATLNSVFDESRQVQEQVKSIRLDGPQYLEEYQVFE